MIDEVERRCLRLAFQALLLSPVVVACQGGAVCVTSTGEWSLSVHLSPYLLMGMKNSSISWDGVKN